MRVLEIVRGLGLGGAERVLVNRLAHAPTWYKFEILNWKSRIDSESILKFIPDTVTLRKLSFFRYLLYLLMHGKEWDALVARTPVDACLLSLFNLVFWRGKPLVVFEAHSNFVSSHKFVDFLLSKSFHLFTKKVDIRIAVSNSVKNGPLCKGYSSTVVIFFGANSYPVSQINSSQITIAFAGSLLPNKRPTWFLERVSGLSEFMRSKDVKTRIFGDGPLREVVLAEIRSRELSDLVEFVGVVHDFPYELRNIDILVSCSISEGLPQVILEAKRAGCAVICTRSGAEEILDDQDIVVGIFDDTAFESALVEMVLNMPKLRHARVKTSSLYANYSVEVGAANFYQYLSKFGRGS